MPDVAYNSSEALFSLKDLSIATMEGCRDLVSGAMGRVIIAPTAYSIKKPGTFGIEIEGVHPAYYYSGLQYSSTGSVLYSRIQHSMTDLGVDGSISVVNPKVQSQKSTLNGSIPTYGANLAAMLDIPLHYYGREVEAKSPADSTKNNTFLTKVINESYLSVTLDSFYEATIDVVATPTEDQWFYIPIGNVKSVDSTMWGKVGGESNLPDGASVGLIKVYGESWLDTSLGGYTVTGEQLEAVQLGSPASFKEVKSYNVLAGSATSNSSNTTKPPAPSASGYDYDGGANTPSEVSDARGGTFLSIPRIATLNDMIQNQTPWYALGYTTGVCTVGTGLFARNSGGSSEVAVYSYGSTKTGLAYKRQYTQDLENPLYQVRMGDLLECSEDYLKSIAKLGYNAKAVSPGTVIPLCASDIQFNTHTSGPAGSYNVPQSDSFRYGQPSFEGDLTPTTPLYLPLAEQYHCYIPAQAVVPVTRFHMLEVTDMEELVNLSLELSPDLLTTEATTDDTSFPSISGSTHDDSNVSGNVLAVWNVATMLPSYNDPLPPRNIYDHPDLVYVDASNPVGYYYYDRGGFVIQRRGSYRSYALNTAHPTAKQVIVDELNNLNLTNPPAVTTGGHQIFTAENASFEIKYTWEATSPNPVVGQQATAALKTLGAGVSGMVMVLAGYIPAGTPVGTYTFKPFSSTQTVDGQLSCKPGEHGPIDVGASGSIQTTVTDAPYIGVNYVYGESPNLYWAADLQADTNYSFYRVLLKVYSDPSKVTGKNNAVVTAVNPEHVPLVGYPMADKPVLMQIDDNSGAHLNEIEDLVFTQPFFDEKLQEWVVIGTSAKHGKMYRVRVEMDPAHNYVTHFQTVVDSAELIDTPYGRFVEILGLCHTKDIHYYDENSEQTKKATAADILFLVDDSGSMPAAMSELKSNIGNMFNTLYNTGIDDIKVGMACYDTKQQSVLVPASGKKWASDTTEAQDMANQLAVSFITTSTDRSAWHWSAIQWALSNYTFRDVKSKYIILVTDATDEGDTTAQNVVKDQLIIQGIKLDVIGTDGTYFDPAVYETDGTFIPMTPEGSKTWGVVMSDSLGSKIVSEIKTAYTLSVTGDHLVILGITKDDDSSIVRASNLVVATCRTSMEWDVNKDTIVRVKIKGPTTTPLTDYVIKTTATQGATIDDRIKWPHSVACLFPYIYVLGYIYTESLTTIDVPYADATELANADAAAITSGNATVRIWPTGAGWQMCMWKIDITSGVVKEPILLTDASVFRFGYGIPASSVDAKTALYYEWAQLGKFPAVYNCSRTNMNMTASLSSAVGLFGASIASFGVSGRSIRIASTDTSNLPKKGENWNYPAVTGLCAVAGQLMAFSNYMETPVLINPLTGVIETTGLSIFPFTFPFDGNVAVHGETVATLAKFGGVNYYTTHPFYQLCIGDGVSPNVYGMGIDVHDITTGSTLVRKCFIRNNNLRDRLEDITLSVPSELVLPGSDMLYLSQTGMEADKAKSIRIQSPLHPCEKASFFLHVTPTASYADDNLVLYLNAKFSRVTEYFGYLMED